MADSEICTNGDVEQIQPQSENDSVSMFVRNVYPYIYLIASDCYVIIVCYQAIIEKHGPPL